MDTPKKLRIYDRLWNWVTPYTKEEIELHNAEVAALKEYERLTAEQADKLELENDEARARVALIEEENERQRKAAMPYSMVARIEFDYQMTLGKEDKVNVTAVFALEETCHDGARRSTFTVLRKANGSFVAEKEYSKEATMNFLGARASYQLYIQPWLDGRLDTADLAGATKVGDCCTKVQFAGGKVG